jgi:hypothetical protein
MLRLFVFLSLAFVLACCSKKQAETPDTTPTETTGFDIEHSDPAAVELADSILAVAGGEESWSKIRFIKWSDSGKNFYWDKLAGNVRIESPDNNTVSILNVSTSGGRMKVGDKELEESDSLNSRIEQEYQAWITSSNKIFLPFNLKQQGFSLKYLGEEELNTGKCNVLTMTHPDKEVAFKIFVDLNNNFIRRTQVLKNNTDSVLSTYNFADYKKYDGLQLAFPEGNEISNFSVNAEVPENLFVDL